MLRLLRTVLWVVALVSLLATGAGHLYRWYQAQQSDSWALELDGRPAPSFTLTDHRRQTVSLEDFTGRITVVTFVFTSCPETCPLTLHKLATAHRELPPDLRQQVQLVAITVDPEHDTVDRMAQYVEANGLDNILFLTGARQALEPVWSGFAITVEQVPAASGQVTLLHTPVTYVLDQEGRLAFLVRDEALDPDRFAGLLERLAAS
ncbi:SCO family protein [Thermomicrobium sp. 4228-Ro]|uniref:SCO family protein n=1 Tax=Thermomicrobium sp. 4228-Ro TaxID=2993937 RepID=UPI0022493C69|nr:SCO family protein [Thermomicrobium sp. 4228-Ro]MCX2727624.1 SCO family protein [Thermomicrobium sp. 4228-Ro]